MLDVCNNLVKFVILYRLLSIFSILFYCKADQLLLQLFIRAVSSNFYTLYEILCPAVCRSVTVVFFCPALRCPVFGDELVIGYFGQSLLRHQSAESASGAKQQRMTPIQLLYQISAANGTDEKLHNFSG